MLTPFEEIFQALNDHKVRYLIVGGLAVVLHGHLRTTADIDLVLGLKKDNLLAAIRALQSLDFRPRPPVPFGDFAKQAKRSKWIKEKGLTVFSTFSPKYPGVEVDLFVEEPFNFEVVFSRASRIPLEKTTATVISLEDLIAMKQKAGRPMDLADIQVLERIKKELSKNEKA